MVRITVINKKKVCKQDGKGLKGLMKIDKL